jgi:hypothetical protein
MRILRTIIIFLAIIFGLLAVIPIFFPKLIESLPNSYKTENYVNYISGVSVTLGSIAGMLFLFLAFIQQQIELNKTQIEREHQKSQEITERFIKSYLKIKEGIKYGGKTSTLGLENFYDNLNRFIHDRSDSIINKEKFSENFRLGVNGSVFSNGGELNLYSRSIKNLISQIVKSDTYDLIPFWEESISEKEKALIFYLFKFYFTDFEDFRTIHNEGFLGSINPDLLISKEHLNW